MKQIRTATLVRFLTLITEIQPETASACPTQDFTEPIRRGRSLFGENILSTDSHSSGSPTLVPQRNIMFNELYEVYPNVVCGYIAGKQLSQRTTSITNFIKIYYRIHRVLVILCYDHAITLFKIEVQVNLFQFRTLS